jgi:hypothetical protein
MPTFRALQLFCLLSFASPALANWQDVIRQHPGLELTTLTTAENSIQVARVSAVPLQSKGTVIFMPAQQRHLLSPQLWGYLFKHLPASGWNILALPELQQQSTVDAATALAADKVQLAARWQALQQLTPSGPLIIIVQGEAAGAWHALMMEQDELNIAAIVSIGAYLKDPAQQRQLQQQMTNLRVPVLDLLTGADHLWSVSDSQRRQQLARTQYNPLYRQRYLPEMHYHSSQQEWLFKEIYGWLSSLGF